MENHANRAVTTAPVTVYSQDNDPLISEICNIHSNLDWSIDQSRKIYGIRGWGSGFFDINAAGEVQVMPNGRHGRAVSLRALIDQAQLLDISLPMVLRMPQILQSRTGTICRAFNSAMDQQGYVNTYTLLYPVKVNQHCAVVDNIANTNGTLVGLEAGSKAELVVALSMASPGATIVCNGYKDMNYMRLAIEGISMGHEVFIVLEKMSEVGLLIDVCKATGVTPRIGIRIRPDSAPVGKWSGSAGSKSKFGLDRDQIGQVATALASAGLQSAVKLMHFHLGSQLSTLESYREHFRVVIGHFSLLRSLGFDIDAIDVGGGLAIDYDGTQSDADSSMDYQIEQYAFCVVQEIKRHCDLNGLQQPAIFSESGRALTAHHGVVLTRVLEVEKSSDELCADSYIFNFSLFQSIPDSWALGQVFPVMPIAKLGEAPTRQGIVHDITCDSDGMIGKYVGANGICDSLPMHDIESGEDYILGIFLTGAYQEALGSNHNLMGVNASANVYLNEDGSLVFKDIKPAASIHSMLHFAGYDAQKVVARIEEKLTHTGEAKRRLKDAFNIHESSYLKTRSDITFLDLRNTTGGAA